MEGEDFQAWTTCWKASLWYFQEISGPLKCIDCAKSVTYPKESQRSAFWVEATRCLGGHRQMTMSEVPSDGCLGVCSDCDLNYVLDVVKGKKTCRREGCRRTVRVNESEVRSRIKNKEDLNDFIILLRKCRTYECEIHGEDVAWEGRDIQALKPPSPDCDHDRKVCDACLKSMFEPAIKGGRLEALQCPDPECKKPIPVETIRANVSTDVFKIYSRKLNQKKLAENPSFRWCSCGHGQLHSAGEANPEWICLSCKARHCFICREASCMHLSKLDEQRKRNRFVNKFAASQIFQKSREERQKQRELEEADKRTKREEARVSKKCPNSSCRVRIQRSAGCAHMTCKQCQMEFCWACKVMWKNGVRLHLDTCRVGTVTVVKREALNTSGYALGWDVDEGYDKTQDEDLWLQGSDR